MQKLTTIFLICVGVILATSGSVAAMSHDHHPSHHAVSPFDKGKELPPHCALNGHSINNPCPHLMKGLKSANSTVIAVDCGGTPNEKQALPENAKKQKVLSVIGKNSGFPDRHSIHIARCGYSFALHIPLFHPPRFI